MSRYYCRHCGKRTIKITTELQYDEKTGYQNGSRGEYVCPKLWNKIRRFYYHEIKGFDTQIAEKKIKWLRELKNGE